MKMKAYTRVGAGTLYPGVDCPPISQANIDYVHRDEIGEIVSSIFLNGFQKLQITRLFSIPSIITTNERAHGGSWGVGGHFTLRQTVPLYRRQILTRFIGTR